MMPKFWTPIFAILLVGIGYLIFFIQSPVETHRLTDLSRTISSSNGSTLELRLNSKGYWRQKVELEEIDPLLIKMLIAYEDKRFYKHKGVDPIAIGRAFLDLIREKRIVSGASTLTMQVARLTKPSLAKRTITSKLKQMAYALRIEHHYTKDEILEAYFTLAPYGGNIEGIKAATNAWLQRDPHTLTASEAAFFVSLPQSPETRRPDRYPENTQNSKNKVLRKTSLQLSIGPDKLKELTTERLSLKRRHPISIAPHLFDKLDRNQKIDNDTITTINYEFQSTVQSIILQHTEQLPNPINAAVLIAERRTGNVVTYVGSSDYIDDGRKGGINYLSSLRSPGSTLKPLIYAEALNRNLIATSHIFNDNSFYKAGYNPANFDRKYMGRINLKDALVTSRNIPAISTLEMLGAQTYEAKIKSILGEKSHNRKRSGLSLAVGGFYVTPEELAKLYLMLANDGQILDLNFEKVTKPPLYENFISSRAADQIITLLAQDQNNGQPLVLKTGTSHKRQDAWSAMITKDHVIIVWLGTPDNEPTKLLLGAKIAMPLAIQISQTLGFKNPNVKPLGDLGETHIVKDYSCGKLINYPENNAWIISDNLRINVIGVSKDQKWYLNGKSIKMKDQNISLDQIGFNTLSSESRNCRETVSFFVRQI